MEFLIIILLAVAALVMAVELLNQSDRITRIGMELRNAEKQLEEALFDLDVARRQEWMGAFGRVDREGGQDA